MGKKRKMPINILGIKLKKGREEQGLSQEEVATRLSERKITSKTIDNWEQGYGLPDENSLEKLVDLYMLDKDEIKRTIETIEYADKQKKYIHRKKFVGRTFLEVFGDFIAKLIKITLVVGIIYFVVKNFDFRKLKNLTDYDTNTHYNIVEDEYITELNSKKVKKFTYNETKPNRTNSDTSETE